MRHTLTCESAGPHRSLKVMSLNVAHGRKLARQQLFVPSHKFQANLADVADVLVRHEPDVVALQEADGPSFWSGDFHHVEHLAELAGFDHHFWGEHNSLQLGRRRLVTGTALMSRTPLGDAASVVFPPSPPTPRKGFVVASLPLPGAPGRSVDLVSVHLDFLSKRARRRQIRSIEEALAPRANPRIILGDMNAWWKRRNDVVPLLCEQLDVRPCRPECRKLATFPSRRPRFRIDWILISPELEFASYATVADAVSDHLGVMAEVHLADAA